MKAYKNGNRVLTCPKVFRDSQCATRDLWHASLWPFMPPDRLNLKSYAYNPLGSSERTLKTKVVTQGECDPVLLWAGGVAAHNVYYPHSADERTSFKLKNGKRIPQHHWDVYDYILAIPAGKVTTYKEVSLAIGGSPRSVGNALRNNPFIPYIPCHRVIASDLTLGGYFGELGKHHKTGTRYHQKLGILEKEGVGFTESGKLACPAEVMWKM